MSAVDEPAILPLLRGSRDSLRLLGRAGVYVAAGALRREQVRALATGHPDPMDVDACAVDDGLAPHEARLYDRWLPPRSRVFLAGCGAGRRLVALAALGHDVTGIDRSASAVSSARAHAARRGVPGTADYGTSETHTPDGPFDAVIVAAACYSTLHSADVRRATLARLAAALRPGGRIIVHYIAHARPSRAARWLMRMSAWIAGSGSRAELGDMFAPSGDGASLTFQRTFRPGEIGHEGGTAGLRLLAEDTTAPEATAVFERWIDVREAENREDDLSGARRVVALATRVDRACAGLAAVLDGAAVGLTGNDTIERQLDRQFAGFEDSAAEVDGGLRTSEQLVYGRHLAPGSRVLLAGCGAGRDLFGLTALGHDVTGLECAADLAAAARAHAARLGIRCTVHGGRVQDASIEGRFDAVILAPACYSYIRGRETRVRTLVRLRQALSPGGRLILHAIRLQRPQPRLPLWAMRTAAWASGAGWRPEPGDVYTDDHSLPKRLRFHHAFADGELEDEARRAGLAPDAVYRSELRADCVVLRVEAATGLTEGDRIQL
ncbi:MAG: methyltransferase domain-containing protein [Vicinamibacterales bacterium]